VLRLKLKNRYKNRLKLSKLRRKEVVFLRWSLAERNAKDQQCHLLVKSFSVKFRAKQSTRSRAKRLARDKCIQVRIQRGLRVQEMLSSNLMR
jgi:hypothetical protein